MQLYNETDREFEDFLQKERGFTSDDIQHILSGRGFKYLFDFMSQKYPKPSQLLEEKTFDQIKPEDISNYA